MYELIATCAAGFQAGAGLHAAIAGSQAATAAQRYHRRTRALNLFLCTASCGSAVAAYYYENHGNLWLVAAAGAGLSVPYHLLLMSPPSSLPPESFQAEQDDVLGALAQKQVSWAAENDSQAPDHVASESGASANHPPPATARRRSRLYRMKSGMLVSPEAAEAAWTRRYWFGAALACVSFGGMMSILATRRYVDFLGGARCF
jgi:hypothetical protein